LTSPSPPRYNSHIRTDTTILAAPHERRWFGLLLLGTALCSLWALGALPLIDVDEPVYGQVGREMARAGWQGWLTPRLGGQPWFDKPPLFYWLTALSMRLFGVSEFAARLPSALEAVGLVAVTYALARRAFPETPRAGLWAGFVLATCVQFLILARAAVTDMTLVLTLIMALYALYVWTKTGQGRWIALCGVMTGLGCLAKGPVALVLVGVQAVGYLLLTRQAKRLLSPALWGGFALCLAVGLPWFLLMIHWHGQLFINGFLEANNVTRYLKAEHATTSPFWFFLPVLLAGFLPWTLALPGTLAMLWRQGRDEWDAKAADGPALFLALWVLLVFGFFSASQSKLVTYIFPLYPALAVLVGAWLAKPSETFALVWPLILYCGVNIALLGALGPVAHKFGIARLTWALWMVTLAGAIPFVVYGETRRVWLVPGIAMALFVLILWCSPTWNVREADVSERKMARVANTLTPPDGVVHALGFKHPSLRFYSVRPVVYTDDHAAAAADMKAHPGVVYALRTSDLDEMRDKYGVTNVEEVYRYGKTALVRATGR